MSTKIHNWKTRSNPKLSEPNADWFRAASTGKPVRVTNSEYASFHSHDPLAAFAGLNYCKNSIVYCIDYKL